MARAAEVCQDRCRAARWKWRKGYGPRKVRVGSWRPSGIQVSYVKALQHLAGWLETDRQMGRHEALQLAARVLRPALSDKQQQRAPAAEQAEMERQHRREEIYIRRIEREQATHERGGVGTTRCGHCGRFKSRPSDRCDFCGDEPGTHNGSAREYDRAVWGQ